jgi:hypothetical protein
MPNPAINSGIRDNHKRGAVADFLKAKIQSGSRLSVVSAYFTIYAYDSLREKLDQIEHLDFLFGEPRFISSLDPEKTEKKSFILDGNGLHLANRLEQKRVARDCAEWIRQKVEIKSIRHAQLLHGKMYHIANAGVEEAILGSSNFTVRGLGLGLGNNNIELNLEVDSNRDRRDLKVWFEELWNDPTLVEDVKDEVLLYAPISKSSTTLLWPISTPTSVFPISYDSTKPGKSGSALTPSPTTSIARSPIGISGRITRWTTAKSACRSIATPSRKNPYS